MSVKIESVVKVDVVKETKKPAPKKCAKRSWAQWSFEENTCFFAGIQKHGRNFRLIKEDITSKTYDQVRHYYYRLLKKITKLLKDGEYTLQTWNLLEVHNSMQAYWKLKAEDTIKENTKEFVAALKEELASRTSKGEQLKSEQLKNEQTVKKEPIVKQQEPIKSEPETDEIDAVIEQFYQVKESIIQNTPQSPSKLVSTLTLRLVPRTPSTADYLKENGFNPNIQLTFKSDKHADYVISHLTQKWVTNKLVDLQNFQLRLFPPSYFCLSHPGWGKEYQEPILTIYSILQNPSKFELEYAWVDQTAIPEPLPTINFESSIEVNSIDPKVKLEPKEELSFKGLFNSENLLPNTTQDFSNLDSIEFRVPDNLGEGLTFTASNWKGSNSTSPQISPQGSPSKILFNETSNDEFGLNRNKQSDQIIAAEFYSQYTSQDGVFEQKNSPPKRSLDSSSRGSDDSPPKKNKPN